MSSSRPLAEGELVVLDDGTQLRCTGVVRRPWSVSAGATLGGTRVFVKQFVDRRGDPHHRGFAGELTVAEMVRQPRALPADCRVPDLIGVSRDRLITASTHVDMSTWDDLAGRPDRDPVERLAHARRTGRTLVGIVRHRQDGDETHIWKGLDPKNIGFDPDGRPVVFDFGPPMTVSPARAGGRIAALGCATGLSRRWDPELLLRPGGPVAALLAEVAQLTDRQHVHQEIDRLLALRRQQTGLAGVAFSLVDRLWHRRAIALWERAVPEVQYSTQERGS